MARGGDFDLARELARPSFTPGQRDVGPLVELVASGNDHAPAALAKLGEAGRRALEAALAQTADEGAAAKLCGALGLFARDGDDAARAGVIAALADPRVRVRRAAIGALGKTAHDDARTALAARWDASDVTPDERRALAEALGKLGGDAAMTRLRALDAGQDAELARRRDRALLMADRSAKRDDASQIATDVAPASPLTVRLHARRGLATLLADDLRAHGLAPRRTHDEWVEVELARPWSALFASRLWVSAGIRVPLPRATDAGPDAPAIVRALTSPAIRALLRAWTRGAIRWRLAFPSGHRRSVVWRVARDVTAAAPELVNDPTNTTWDVLVDDDALELVPRRADDPRFAWRVATVPAASHPTVAAALARVAGVKPTDRVWDPFVGSGGELVERALLGPTRSLTGSDLSEEALAAARANLAAANIAATLILADARTHSPGPVDLVITNPPLGSRIHLDAAALLVETLPNVVRQLAPSGRLVWITPQPRRTTPVAEHLGLRRALSLAIDLGGVRGHLERWER
jgi:hypothetical protein